MYLNISEYDLDLITSVSGQQGFQWKKLEIDISSFFKFRLVLEAVIGDGILGDIAIDDISFIENISCKIITNPPLTTTTTYPSAEYDCNFESGSTCQWSLDLTNDINWKIQQGASDVLFTGPSADHTLQTAAGYYAYIKTGGIVTSGDVAKLKSLPVNSGFNGICLKFFYHMYGTNINRLNIYSKTEEYLDKPIWQKIGEQGNKWILGQVYVEKLDNFQFVIEGVAGNGAR